MMGEGLLAAPGAGYTGLPAAPSAGYTGLPAVPGTGCAGKETWPQAQRLAVVLGNPQTKRTLYLERAAAALGFSFYLLDWRQLKGEGSLPDWEGKEIFMKIDPPLWDSCDLGEQNRLAAAYRQWLQALSHMAPVIPRSCGFPETGPSIKCRQLSFLNSPEVIAALLDKEQCKMRLSEAGIPVTELFLPESPGKRKRFWKGEELLEAMKKQRVYQVFLKPIYGSGAAGIGAFRFQPGTGRMALYTCAQESPSGAGIVNTKVLQCVREPERVHFFLDQLLASECVAERWYPKAEHQGQAYDLRVVVQRGRVDFLLARQSRGPVTNLHLNNSPLDVKERGLPGQVLEEVKGLCQSAAGLYPGLTSAGIDVLLEKGSLRPRIIEMNGQGDLIYQDIYNQNRIYHSQAWIMREWLDG